MRGLQVLKLSRSQNLLRSCKRSEGNLKIMSTLVIAEHDNSSLKKSTLNTITAASAVGEPVDVLIAGADCQAAAAAAAGVAGVRAVIVADGDAYLNQLPEAVAPLVKAVSGDYSHLFAAATTAGKNLMPRVAALLDVGQISDIVEVKSPDTFVRPIYAGNAMATVQSSDPVKVVTVRTTAFAEAGEGKCHCLSVRSCDRTSHDPFLGEQLSVSERPELTAASIIVSGGRGMQDGSNFALLEKVADKLEQRLAPHVRRSMRDCTKRLSGRPNRQDCRSGSLYSGRNIGRDSASGWNERFKSYRGNQQGRRSANLSGC